MTIGRSRPAARMMLAAVTGAAIAAGCATAPAGSSAGAAAPGTPPASATSAAATTTTGPIPAYRLDPTHTFVHWEIVHMGTSTIRGRFDTATGSVQFDPEGKRLDVSISIDTASVDSA